MIKRFLRHLRQQPKGVRDNIALGVAITFTAVVVFGWMYSLPMKVADRMSRIASGAQEKPGFTALFGGIKDQVAGAVGANDVEVAVATTADMVTASHEREVVGDDYRVVMPQASQKKIGTTSTTTSNASSTEILSAEVATSTVASSTPPRAIRIVTTNTSTSSSTASSTR